MATNYDKTCFVIMPFGETGTFDREQFDDTYENIIEAAVKESKLDLHCLRVDKINEPGEIIGDFTKYVKHARVVICDLTKLNANVMYELGLRHGFNHESAKTTILIAEEGTKLPFDIKVLRTIFYSKKTIKKANEAKAGIVDFLKGIDLSPNNAEALVEVPIIETIVKKSTKAKDLIKEEIEKSPRNFMQVENFKKKLVSLFQLSKYQQVSLKTVNSDFLVYSKDTDLFFVNTKLNPDYESIDFYNSFLDSLLKLKDKFPVYVYYFNTLTFIFCSNIIIDKDASDKILKKIENIYINHLPNDSLAHLTYDICKFRDDKVNFEMIDLAKLEEFESKLKIEF